MKPIATAILILLILIIFLFFAVRNANRQNLVPTGSDAHDIKERAGMGGETIMLFFMVYLITLCIFSFFSVKGQNLVPNGDFELYSSCPSTGGQIDHAIPWVNPANTGWGGTPDYFNQCSPSFYAAVPNNYFGFQNAHSGDGYIGLVAGRINTMGLSNWREYAEVPLTSTLVANQCYHFEMYISLGNSCLYTSDVMGVYFSDILVTGINNTYPLPYTPQIDINLGFFTDTLNWINMTGNFTASGGENYIIIGNFKDSTQTNTVLINPTGILDYSYFFIDDVSLSPCTAIEEQNQNEAIKIYPNPVKDEFQVSGLKFLVGEKTELSIYDMEGRKVFEQANLQSSIFNIQSLNSGIYFIEITDEKNVHRKKFLKE